MSSCACEPQAPALVDEVGQPAECLEGFWRDARALSEAHGDELRSVPDVITWLQARPHKEDTGKDPGRRIPGCTPWQRSEWLPDGGLNCWERAVHWAAWQIANSRSLEDWEIRDSVNQNNERHIFVIDRRTGLDLSSSLMPVDLSQAGALRRALQRIGVPCNDEQAPANAFDFGNVVRDAKIGAAVGSQSGEGLGGAIGAGAGGVVGALDEVLKNYGYSSGGTGSGPALSVGVEHKVSLPGWVPAVALLLGGALLLKRS